MRALFVAPLVACTAEVGIRADIDPVTFDEGTPLDSELQEDVYVQTLVPASDVLFVVDNSCSMANEQAQLAENFTAFLETILQSDTDFHVGVVSTDMTDPMHSGRLQEGIGFRWIDPDTPRPESAYEAMVSLGVTGDPEERGRDAAFTAIELLGDEWNEGFVREAASLHVMVVSDEDDASDIVGFDEFVEYLRGLKVAPFETTFSSVVGPVGSTMGPFSSCSAVHGEQYVALTAEVGGIDFSICK
ncbi:MAG: vWA domain-containing protein, partial [Myxococcota bacterium]